MLLFFAVQHGFKHTSKKKTQIPKKCVLILHLVGFSWLIELEKTMNTKLAMLAGLIGFVGITTATEFCVSTPQELQTALWTAEGNGDDNHIKIVTGIYSTLDNGSLNQGFQYSNSGPEELIISGGWRQTSPGSNCFISRILATAYETVLTGAGVDRVLEIAAGNSSANVTVYNLSIQSGFPYSNFNHTGGLYIAGASTTDLVNDVVIERVVFIGNEANASSALRIESAGRVEVKNSLFRNNTVNNAYTASITSNSVETIYLTNNTVVNNESTNSIGGIILWNAGSGGSVAANNIMWNNDVRDIVFSGISANHHLLHNIVQDVTGNAGIDIGNSDVNPQLNTDFSLSHTSPAIDSGVSPLQNQPNPPIELDWFVGERDLLGYPREMGATVDKGAIEVVDNIFTHGFE